MKLTMNRKNTNEPCAEIPYGIRCFGSSGEMCPYYKVSGVLYLTKRNCEHAAFCDKDCGKERCRNVFVSCDFKNKIESYADKKFLLAHKYKICGVNLNERKKML